MDLQRSLLIGAIAGAAFPTRAVNLAAALVFFTVGLATLRADDPGVDTSHEPDTSRPVIGVVGTVTLAMVLAELGDKTMLATISLAAGGETVATWIGATAGITSAGLLGVGFGGTIARRVPPQIVRLGAGALFIAIGALVLVAELG